MTNDIFLHPFLWREVFEIHYVFTQSGLVVFEALSRYMSPVVTTWAGTGRRMAEGRSVSGLLIKDPFGGCVKINGEEAATYLEMH